MKHVSRMTLVVWLVCIGGMGLPEKVDATCWNCDLTQGCFEACEGNSGKTWCATTKVCGFAGCSYVDCDTWGASCTGTANCGGSCHQSIEECGPQNVASLVIPNGEAPADDRSWLELRDNGLQLCETGSELPADPLPNSTAEMGPQGRAIAPS